MENDVFYTIKSLSEGEFKDKGSKFIGYAFPFEQIETLKKHLEEIKSLHPKARHYCYAYKLGSDSDYFRVNDDGEPSGSAGRPILNSILSKNLTNILIIVVRYFGGTLLGVPGLINAYKSASIEAINNAEIEKKYLYHHFVLKYDFEKTNEVMRIIKEFGLKILNQEYIEKCMLTLEIRQSISEKIIEKFEGLRDIEIDKRY
jgi:uncharacterized YigZ family protein